MITKANPNVPQPNAPESYGPLLHDIYERLLAHFGHQNWWPGDSRLEIMVGAVLTQNTNWRNAHAAIAALKQSDLLRADLLAEMPQGELAQLIRPTGYYNLKAARLQSLMRLIAGQYGGDVDRLDRLDTATMRTALLDIHGIGPETADSICLYAYQRPLFVVDTYTRRLLYRHGLLAADAGYDDMQHIFHITLPRDEALYNEYHALIVRLGQHFCRATMQCAACPMNADELFVIDRRNSAAGVPHT